jgi:hypothetical protein
MAIGTISDFTTFQEQVHGGMVETLAQNTETFNAASRNTIRLVNRKTRGDYNQETFYKNISGLVIRRDNTSVASATDLALTQDQLIGVKLNRTVGPVAQTLDAFKKVAESLPGPDPFGILAMRLGAQIAKSMEVDWLDSGLRAAVAAHLNQSAAAVAQTGTTITTTNLVDLLANFGDQASRIRAFVMHSKVWYDLVKDQINLNVTDVSSFSIAEGSALTMGRPVIITDSVELRSAAGSTSPDNDFDYYTLGLVENGLVLEDSEDTTIVTDRVTGLDSLVIRVQGEHAFNVNLKGYKWDISNGGANPLDSALGTGSNWDLAASDIKDTSGVILSTK